MKICQCRGNSNWKVSNILMDGGATRKRRAIPPIEKPISWVDITSIQPSKSKLSPFRGDQRKLKGWTFTGKAPFLVIVNALHGYNVCGIGALRTHACHYGNQDLNGLLKHSIEVRRGGDKNLTCSLMVNGPGFNFIPRIDTVGHSFTQARPTGNTRSWATS